MLSVSGFSELLAARLAERQESISAFARAVDCAHSFISHILRDERRPPLEDLPLWAKHLGIAQTSADFQRFCDLAAIAHLPKAIQPRFEAMLARLASLEALAQDLDRRTR